MCAPVAIAGHACDCAAVGAANARPNHSRTCGVKASSGILPGYSRAAACPSCWPYLSRRRAPAARAARRARRAARARPAFVACTQVRVRLPSKPFSTSTSPACSSTAMWRERLPSVSSSVSRRKPKSARLASLSTARIPSRTRWWTVSSSRWAGWVTPICRPASPAQIEDDRRSPRLLQSPGVAGLDRGDDRRPQRGVDARRDLDRVAQDEPERDDARARPRRAARPRSRGRR